jgi:hypothetical protein
MMVKHKNQTGFVPLEGLLILMIVGLISGTGWYVWHSKNLTDKNLNNANNSLDDTKASSASKKSQHFKIFRNKLPPGWSYTINENGALLVSSKPGTSPTKPDRCAVGVSYYQDATAQASDPEATIKKQLAILTGTSINGMTARQLPSKQVYINTTAGNKQYTAYPIAVVKPSGEINAASTFIFVVRDGDLIQLYESCVGNTSAGDQALKAVQVVL